MKEIPLTLGKVALVDDADYAAVARFHWSLHSTAGLYYAMRRFRDDMDDRHGQLLHRFILGDPAGSIDHIDGNGLNNTRTNLRLATPSQNQGNSRRSVDNTSGYKGVTYHKVCRKWYVQIGFGRHKVYLGMYLEPHDAAAVYDAAARIVFGEFARVNFSDESIPLPRGLETKIKSILDKVELEKVNKALGKVDEDD